MTIPELFRRLKPLYPGTIARLWIEYQIADPERRREIDELLTILSIKRQGMMIGDEKLVLDAPPAPLIGHGEILLGSVSYPGLAPYPVRVSRHELLRHIFILGPTGTGKSTLLLGLLQQLQELSVPFMVFDFKRNYRVLLHTPGNSPIVFTVGRPAAPLHLNVLAPPAGVSFEEWADGLADIISTSYLLLQGARNVLKDALLRAQREYAEEATLAHAHTILQAGLATARAGSRRSGWLESATRSLEELTKGSFGHALNDARAPPLATHLQRATVFELHGFGDDQKRFFCLYWLQAILLLRKTSTARREHLQHVLVFDEAHNVFPRERLGEVSLPARLAREVREYGEAIISATQQADVSESLIANSGFKVILRCDYPKDVHFASQLLQIEPKWLPKLTIGCGIARFPTRCYTPFQFTFEEQPIKNRTITDEEVRAQWARHGTRAAAAPPAVTPPQVAERERALLRDVAAHPISPVTHRYQRLGWHMESGNRTKDAVITKGLARFDAVSTPRGQVKILTLTPQGIALLAARGVTLRQTRGGGAEHEFWKHELRTLLERSGYTVSEEHPLGGGRTADLRATREGRALFVEIETGRSDIPANVAKYESSQELVVFFTSEEVASRYRDLVMLDRLGTRCLTPRELHRLAE